MNQCVWLKYINIFKIYIKIFNLCVNLREKGQFQDLKMSPFNLSLLNGI